MGYLIKLSLVFLLQTLICLSYVVIVCLGLDPNYPITVGSLIHICIGNNLMSISLLPSKLMTKMVICMMICYFIILLLIGRLVYMWWKKRSDDEKDQVLILTASFRKLWLDMRRPQLNTRPNEEPVSD